MMTINDVVTYMNNRGYIVESSKEIRCYEDKKYIHTILQCQKTKNGLPLKTKNLVWFRLENRDGDVYPQLDEWTWYFSGKAYDSNSNYEHFDKEIIELKYEEILGDFIDKVENYSKG